MLPDSKMAYLVNGAFEMTAFTIYEVLVFCFIVGCLWLARQCHIAYEQVAAQVRILEAEQSAEYGEIEHKQPKKTMSAARFCNFRRRARLHNASRWNKPRGARRSSPKRS
jgi:hypothetical protein